MSFCHPFCDPSTYLVHGLKLGMMAKIVNECIKTYCLGNFIKFNIHVAPFCLSFMPNIIILSFCFLSVSDAVYTRCFCTEKDFTHKCPKGTTQVLTCPPMLPKKGLLCCAKIDKTNGKRWKPGMAHGFRLRFIIKMLND